MGGTTVPIFWAPGSCVTTLGQQVGCAADGQLGKISLNSSAPQAGAPLGALPGSGQSWSLSLSLLSWFALNLYLNVFLRANGLFMV